MLLAELKKLFSPLTKKQKFNSTVYMKSYTNRTFYIPIMPYSTHDRTEEST